MRRVLAEFRDFLKGEAIFLGSVFLLVFGVLGLTVVAAIYSPAPEPFVMDDAAWAMGGEFSRR